MLNTIVGVLWIVMALGFAYAVWHATFRTQFYGFSLIFAAATVGYFLMGLHFLGALS